MVLVFWDLLLRFSGEDRSNVYSVARAPVFVRLRDKLSEFSTQCLVSYGFLICPVGIGTISSLSHVSVGLCSLQSWVVLSVVSVSFSIGCANQHCTE